MRGFLLRSAAVLALASTAAAAGPPQRSRLDCDLVDPDSSVVLATFATPGRDAVTIAPDARTESLGENGILIAVTLKLATGAALAGIPRQEMVLWDSGLCVCPGGMIADAATDLYGRTTFSGPVMGGGSARSLSLYVGGVFLAAVPIRVNSPDLNGDCSVDAGDIASFATRLGSRSGDPGYAFGADFNEDGFIDCGDVAKLAATLGAGGCGY